jgi:hypothetical protein
MQLRLLVWRKTGLELLRSGGALDHSLGGSLLASSAGMCGHQRTDGYLVDEIDLRGGSGEVKPTLFHAEQTFVTVTEEANGGSTDNRRPDYTMFLLGAGHSWLIIGLRRALLTFPGGGRYDDRPD